MTKLKTPLIVLLVGLVAGAVWACGKQGNAETVAVDGVCCKRDISPNTSPSCSRAKERLPFFTSTSPANTT